MSRQDDFSFVLYCKMYFFFFMSMYMDLHIYSSYTCIYINVITTCILFYLSTYIHIYVNNIGERKLMCARTILYIVCGFLSEILKETPCTLPLLYSVCVYVCMCACACIWAGAAAAALSLTLVLNGCDKNMRTQLGRSVATIRIFSRFLIFNCQGTNPTESDFKMYKKHERLNEIRLRRQIRREKSSWHLLSE